MTAISRIRFYSEEISKPQIDKNCDLLLGGQKFSIPQACDIISKAVNQYDKVEMSPKRRIDTLEKLSSSLKLLADRVKNCKTTFKSKQNLSANKILEEISHINKVKKTQNRFFLITIIQEIWDSVCSLIIKCSVYLIKNKRTYQLKECIFRTTKNLSTKEASILNPKFGGALQRLSLISIQKDIQRFIDANTPYLSKQQMSALETIKEQLKFAEQISFEHNKIFLSVKLDSKTTIETKIADIAYEIEKKISKLSIGQSMIIPGGYAQNGKGGHAIIYEVKKTAKNDFAFNIYNTGIGASLNFNMLWVVQGVLKGEFIPKTASPISLQNLSFEGISDQKFLSTLNKYISGLVHTENPIDSLIRDIKHHCQELNGANLTRLESHHTQTWGTCAHDSVLAYIQAKLDPYLFESFENYTRLTAKKELEKILHLERKSNSFSPAVLDLIEAKSAEVSSPHFSQKLRFKIS